MAGSPRLLTRLIADIISHHRVIDTGGKYQNVYIKSVNNIVSGYEEMSVYLLQFSSFTLTEYEE